MKKIVFLILSIFIVGCGAKHNDTTVVNCPYEILYNNKILSYYGHENEIDKDEFNVVANGLFFSQNTDQNTVIVNEEGSIRSISITDEKIVTYKQISVGDSIEEVIDAFDNEYELGNGYSVLFDGVIEEDPASENKSSDWIWINYTTDDSKITRITIYDVEFGNTAK